MYWMTKRIPHTDRDMIIACFAYCEAKPFWWRWFYGWRKSDRESCTFTLTEKAWVALMDLVDENPHYPILKK